MARTVKDTTLDFGLVSAPVKLKSVVPSSKGDSLKLASPSGEAVKQVYIVEETGEVVGPRNECRRGVFDENGFHEVSDEALKQIDEEVGMESISIDGFMPLADVPWERAKNIYFLAPGGKGDAAKKPLALLRDGLASFERAAYGRVTINAVTYPFVISSRTVNEDGDLGLVLNTMNYAAAVEELADAGKALAGAETDANTLALAGTLMDQIAAKASEDGVTLDSYHDDRTEKRVELIALAVAGKAIPVSEKPVKQAAGGDLADILAASIAAAAGPPKKKSSSKTKVAAA